jgi:hypothetical protein
MFNYRAFELYGQHFSNPMEMKFGSSIRGPGEQDILPGICSFDWIVGFIVR